MMMGYLNQEEKTRETIDDEGWLHSGDLGKFDEVSTRAYIRTHTYTHTHAHTYIHTYIHTILTEIPFVFGYCDECW